MASLFSRCTTPAGRLEENALIRLSLFDPLQILVMSLGAVALLVSVPVHPELHTFDVHVLRLGNVDLTERPEHFNDTLVLPLRDGRTHGVLQPLPPELHGALVVRLRLNNAPVECLFEVFTWTTLGSRREVGGQVANGNRTAGL